MRHAIFADAVVQNGVCHSFRGIKLVFEGVGRDDFPAIAHVTDLESLGRIRTRSIRPTMSIDFGVSQNVRYSQAAVTDGAFLGDLSQILDSVTHETNLGPACAKARTHNFVLHVNSEFRLFFGGAELTALFHTTRSSLPP